MIGGLRSARIRMARPSAPKDTTGLSVRIASDTNDVVRVCVVHATFPTMIARLHRDTLMVRTFLHGTLLSAALALAGPALAQEAALLSVDGPNGSRSYDLPALLRFLSDVKGGRRPVPAWVP